MDNWLLIIILILLLLVITLLFAVSLLVIYFFRISRKLHNTDTNNKIDCNRPTKSNKAYCHVHSDQKSAGTCAICELPFCEECLTGHDKLNFCPDHYRLFLENSWSEVSSVKTTPSTPQKGLHIYKVKKEAWEQNAIPSYIVTYYKIDTESDIIESHVKLFAMTSDLEKIQAMLTQSNSY